MALNTKYEEHKVEVELKRWGTEVIVFRPDVDRFHEEDEIKGRILGTFTGLYHETNESVIGAATLMGFASATTRYEKIPMVMCLMRDIPKEEMRVGDVIQVNGKQYQFNGLTDLDDLHKVADITMAVLDDGGYV